MLLGVVFIGSMVVVGCRNKQHISDSEASEVMKEKLYEKYGEEFEVSESWRITDTDMGMPGIGGGWSYCADVYTKDGQTFQVAIDNDGNNFEDDYCKIILDKPLKEYVYGLVEKVEGIKVKDYGVVFYRDSKCWSEKDDVEAYLEVSETYINLDVEVTAESVEEAAIKCYEVYKILYDHNTDPGVSFMYQGKETYMAGEYENRTREDIIEDFIEDFG